MGTWKLAVENIAAVLAGREWLQVVFVVAVGTSAGALFLLGCWLACHPHYLPLLWKTVPWALGALATVKLLLARSVLQKTDGFRNDDAAHRDSAGDGCGSWWRLA